MATHSRIFSRKARIAWSNTAKSLLTFGNLRKQNFLGWRVILATVVCHPTSGQRSVCASASIIDYEIAPDKANERLCSTSFSLSLSVFITLCRACYSIGFVLVRRVQVRRLTFRLSDDRGGRGEEEEEEREGHKRVHTREYTRSPCLSRTLRLKHCPLSRHPLTLHTSRSAMERFTRAQV